MFDSACRWAWLWDAVGLACFPRTFNARVNDTCCSGPARLTWLMMYIGDDSSVSAAGASPASPTPTLLRALRSAACTPCADALGPAGAQSRASGAQAACACFDSIRCTLGGKGVELFLTKLHCLSTEADELLHQVRSRSRGAVPLLSGVRFYGMLEMAPLGFGSHEHGESPWRGGFRTIRASLVCCVGLTPQCAAVVHGLLPVCRQELEYRVVGRSCVPRRPCLSFRS